LVSLASDPLVPKNTFDKCGALARSRNSASSRSARRMIGSFEYELNKW
jgi:hypothetical protein